MKKNRDNLFTVTLVILIATYLYLGEYKNTYKDPSKRKELSSEIIFID